MSRPTKEQEVEKLIDKCAFSTESVGMIEDLEGLSIQESKMANIVIMTMKKSFYDKIQSKNERKLKEYLVEFLKKYNLNLKIDSDQENQSKGILYIISDYGRFPRNPCHSISTKTFFGILPYRYIGQTASPFNRITYHRQDKEEWWNNDNATIVFIFCKDHSLQDNIKSWLERELFLDFHVMSNCVLKNGCIPNGTNSPLSAADGICARKMKNDILLCLRLTHPEFFEELKRTIKDDFIFLCALEQPLKYNKQPSIVIGVRGINEFYLQEGCLLVNEKYCGNAQGVIKRNKLEREILLSEGAIKEVKIKNEDGTIDDYYQYECQRDICFDRTSSAGQFCKMAAVDGPRAFKVYKYPKITDISFEKAIKQFATSMLKCLDNDNASIQDNNISSGSSNNLTIDNQPIKLSDIVSVSNVSSSFEEIENTVPDYIFKSL